jgi:hypothetical protein
MKHPSAAIHLPKTNDTVTLFWWYWLRQRSFLIVSLNLSLVAKDIELSPPEINNRL